MKHAFWVILERLAGRCGPDVEPWSLEEIRESGIHVVVSLSSDSEPSRAEFAAAGLEVGWFPLPADYPANDVTQSACLRTLPKAGKFLDAHLRAGRNVLVHCSWGRDRTGLLLAYYLARSASLTSDAAIARVRQVRPKALSALGWEEMAARVIAGLSSDARNT